MKKIVTLFSLVLVSFTFFAQNHSVGVPYKNIVKNTNYGILHEYIQIDNLLNQDFGMRWIADVGGKSGCPTGWLIGISDPDSVYTTIISGDSADFILSGTDSVGNKMVISVAHNGLPGDCSVNFRLYELSNPNTITNIGFNITVTPGPVGIDEDVEMKKIGYPNPTKSIYYFNANIKKCILYDVLGNLVVERVNVTELDMSNFSNGTYLILLEDENGEYHQEKIIKE